MKTITLVLLLAAVLPALPTAAHAAPFKKSAAKTANAARAGSKAVGHGATTAKRKTVSGAKFLGKHVKRAVTP